MFRMALLSRKENEELSMKPADILRMNEFYESLPILLDQEYTSYSPSLQAHHEIFWENIYQAFKKRIAYERGGE